MLPAGIRYTGRYTALLPAGIRYYRPFLNFLVLKDKKYMWVYIEIKEWFLFLYFKVIRSLSFNQLFDMYSIQYSSIYLVLYEYIIGCIEH